MGEQYWYSHGRKVTYWQAVRNLVGHLMSEPSQITRQRLP